MMFDRFFKAVKEFFTAEPLKNQFEEMVLQDAVKKAEVQPAPVAAQAAVNDQITDAVTTEQPAKPKKARAAKVKEVEGDDKAPEKKPRAPRKKKEVK